jgi:ubiquinone/menaquinone biosynthesis C-methylase UbiE
MIPDECNDIGFKFGRMEEFWRIKFAQYGDRYVGRIKEDHTLQQKRIESILMTRLRSQDYFEKALDFGCGWGRFIPFFSQFCGHIWAVDLVKEMVDKAAQKAPNVTAIQSKHPFKLPGKESRFDLLWSCFVFQHITDDEVFDVTTKELRRVLKSGARVIIIDNAVDHASHVKPRSVERLAEALELKPTYYASKVTVNQRADDHWLIDGVKK